MSDCYTADWTSSFDNQGWSACATGYIMTKLRFDDLSGTAAPSIGSIEQVQCCRLPLTTPAWPIQTISSSDLPNWWTLMDTVNVWAVCPTNEFLAGLRVPLNPSGCAAAYSLPPASALSLQSGIRFGFCPCGRLAAAAASVAPVILWVVSKMRDVLRHRVHRWVYALMCP